MKLKLKKERGGFTLVEIMVVVAIIAMLAAIALPNFLRARKRSQATRILQDLRIMDSALDLYAIETNKTSTSTANWADIQVYLKKGSALYTSNHTDLLGNTYGTLWTIDKPPIVNPSTFIALSDVAPAAFWSPYK